MGAMMLETSLQCLGNKHGPVQKEYMCNKGKNSDYVSDKERSNEVIKTMFRNKFWLVMGICLMVALSSSNAFAWRSGGPREVVVVGHNRYNYHDGRFYRPGWFGIDFVVSPPLGAIVTVLPSRHSTIVVRGGRYYYYDNIYYIDGPSGYVVVTPP